MRDARLMLGKWCGFSGARVRAARSFLCCAAVSRLASRQLHWSAWSCA
jgi:hypothetical protein